MSLVAEETVVSARMSPRAPPTDIRHVTSLSALSPTSTTSSSGPGALSVSPASVLSPRGNRMSQYHLGGSISPSSIPSSPTSVHSSSSAIFERDIEPLPSSVMSGIGSPTHIQQQPQLQQPSISVSAHPPHPTHPTNPHHIARGHTTESLEQNVPSVLDSAAEILANIQVAVPTSPASSTGVGDVLIVEAPAPMHHARTGGTSAGSVAGTRSGWTSPTRSVRSVGSLTQSRSPSPLASQAGGQGSLLLSVSPHPTIDTQQKAPAMESISMETPTSAYFSVKDNEEDNDDEEERTEEGHSHARRDTYSPISPHSHSSLSTKRLSFLSYTDLLTSTPTSTLPLSSLTTAANAGVEPPHITALGGVIGELGYTPDQYPSSHATSHSHTTSTTSAAYAASSSSSPPSSPLSIPATSEGAAMNASQRTVATVTASPPLSTTTSPRSNRNSIISRSPRTNASSSNSNRTSQVFLDDLVGGEWEREGFGSGLEERLERVVGG
ncbi:hypothetical protein EV361DRAFT_878845 [Lentinula raphanica]|nr:hypothetical protein F5880DRAFT_1617242 [Lentinula raphanica]KAJ3977491.1 hypothetical protein EV361DRAFT_878845 [Lentinula raphanica]